MNLQAKIASALAFLFAIILLLGGLGAYYLNQLSNDSQAILTDNYDSLEYGSNMQKTLADAQAKPDSDAYGEFERNLTKEQANITEVGEGSEVAAIRREFNRLRALSPTDPSRETTIGRIRAGLFRIDDINRHAIVRKNEVAKRTAKDALVWLAAVGTLCFLIVLSFIINFPAYIARPLRELTEGIKQVASHNFEERLHFKSSDEFGELARSFNSMAQKLDEFEHSNIARILFEKKRIDTLIQVMSDGIIGLDQNRYVLFVNQVASRLLGLSEADLLGKYAPDVATHNDLMRTLIQDVTVQSVGPTAIPQGTPPTTGMEPSLLKIYDGDKESYFTRQTQPVDITRTGDTQTVRAGYVIVLKNITSYKELDQAKTNFIATVSHELKTPISSIKMSLKLLDDQRVGQLNPEQKSLIANVRGDADRLLSITGELLNMAQVESGQIQLNLQPVAPTDIISYAVNALRVTASQRHIDLRTNLPATLPDVRTDPDKASWVLINFLSNAVRHSPDEGRIEVSAKTTEQGVEFRVRDHGAGIRPEHRDRIFDRYFRAPGSSGQPSGTGLGLAISGEFIQSMNGQIGLDTTVTDGAAFWFTLPRA
ncbi:HAMP domain-containing sensor histidine kinase [Fibrella aquatilis]|uniref:histidine kinase n=1 Tax=Fibrella aquatilis TaxID=2817059 RepID=A0A939JWD9_9BACT|nr:ATP-binding protein [Fibrella aquatilis]MBO0929889.1 HAMP domain-containing protein [Fibrella aquatilis]